MVKRTSDLANSFPDNEFAILALLGVFLEVEKKSWHDGVGTTTNLDSVTLKD